jgi:hypothetical protein
MGVKSYTLRYTGVSSGDWTADWTLGNKKKRMADFLLSCKGMRGFHSGRFVLNFIFPVHNQVTYQHGIFQQALELKALTQLNVYFHSYFLKSFLANGLTTYSCSSMIMKIWLDWILNRLFTGTIQETPINKLVHHVYPMTIKAIVSMVVN